MEEGRGKEGRREEVGGGRKSGKEREVGEEKVKRGNWKEKDGGGMRKKSKGPRGGEEEDGKGRERGLF